MPLKSMDFNEIARKFRSWMRMCAVKHIHFNEVDDVIQLALLRAWKAYHKIEGKHEAQIARFLENCVRLEALDLKRNMNQGRRRGKKLKRAFTNAEWRCSVRGRGRSQFSVLDLIPTYTEFYDESPVEKALTYLPKYEREVIALVAEGWSKTKIAEKLGRCPETVCRYLESAKAKLKRQLERNAA